MAQQRSDTSADHEVGSKPGPVKLTDAAIQKLKPLKDRPREIPIAGHEGLRLVVYPSGKRSFQMRFRRPGGQHGKLVLGTYDPTGKELKGEPVIGQPLTLAAAHALAASTNRDRAKGIDVIEERRAEKSRRASAAEERTASAFGLVIREFVTDYRTKRGGRPRRWRDDAATLGLRYPPGSDPTTVDPKVIKGSLAETWADKPITEIDKYLVDAAVDDARKRGSVGRARKLYAALSVLFKWLPLKYRVEVSPMIGTKSKPRPPKPRDRKLDAAEIVIFWKACGNINGLFGALYRTLLLTGCRLREAGGMARAELGDNGVWEIPSPRTKNHLPFMVPLPQLALDVINSVPAPTIKTPGSNSGLVFTSNDKTPVSGFSKTKKLLDAEMAKIAGQPIKPWRVHDLRRTFSTFLNESPDDGGLGIAPHIVEACLNHISGAAKGGVAGVYNKAAYLSEKRAALQRWARYIALVVDAKLHTAHEQFLLRDHDDERKPNHKHFLDAIADGGAAWQTYLDMLAGKAPPKVATLDAVRKRRQR